MVAKTYHLEDASLFVKRIYALSNSLAISHEWKTVTILLPLMRTDWYFPELIGIRNYNKIKDGKSSYTKPPVRDCNLYFKIEKFTKSAQSINSDFIWMIWNDRMWENADKGFGDNVKCVISTPWMPGDDPVEWKENHDAIIIDGDGNKGVFLWYGESGQGFALLEKDFLGEKWKKYCDFNWQ